MSTLLELRECTMQFGGLTALSKVSLQMGPTDLVGLIGPNGAGKTTVFNIMTGIYEPTSGTIQLNGKSIVGRKASAIAARGIARTFQNIRLFASLSVYDNVRAAFTMNLKHGIAHALWRGGPFRKEEEEINQKVFDILQIFKLEDAAKRSARACPTAINAAWKSSAPSRHNRSCSCWTSRPRE